ncbi:uncharacterized protein Bfra_000141 [Botrytis fragariae]|uniref:BTB domain-containing protein n=1 Tax=Botrytis fragariae TaxID=1964551 RepID=A0A8H6B234_9HELO|nr:uncharacterized protein Bfra_000141 [Botrytis fragariae]KAF5877976.1 hypothetical protein Bfra_000141 [Botrytis fragariae]
MTSTTLAGAPVPVVSPTVGDSLGLEIVTLIVGPKRKEFAVHKKLICDSCDYFKKAFCGPFLEGTEGKIYFPEDGSDAVALFVEWLHRRKWPINRTHAQFDTFIKLYLLSEKWCFYRLRNIVINGIKYHFWLSDEEPSYVNHLLLDVVNYIWNQTEDKSPLRLLCIKRLAWFYHDETTPNIIPGRDDLKQLWVVCKEYSSFFEDFFAYFQNFTKDTKPSNPGRVRENGRCVVEICSYHRHGEREGCAKLTEAEKDKKQNGGLQRHEFFADLLE